MTICPDWAPALRQLRPCSPLRLQAFSLLPAKSAYAARASLICNQGVTGSSPVGGTLKSRPFIGARPTGFVLAMPHPGIAANRCAYVPTLSPARREAGLRPQLPSADDLPRILQRRSCFVPRVAFSLRHAERTKLEPHGQKEKTLDAPLRSQPYRERPLAS